MSPTAATLARPQARTPERPPTVSPTTPIIPIDPIVPMNPTAFPRGHAATAELPQCVRHWIEAKFCNHRLQNRVRTRKVSRRLTNSTNIHARQYQLYLPSKEELQRKLLQWAEEAGGE
jgi:hypothetical protein